MRISWRRFGLDAALGIWICVRVFNSHPPPLDEIAQKAHLVDQPTTIGLPIVLPKKAPKYVNNTDKLLAFRLENLAEGQHRCGLNKCFFPLETEGYTHYGYVAGVRGTMLAAMEKAYKLAFDIEKKYHLKHVYVQPPHFLLNISDPFRQWLDSNKTDPNGLPTIPAKAPVFGTANRPPKPIVAQLVETIPQDDSALFWAATPDKLYMGWEKLDAWLTQRITSGDSATLLQVFTKDLQNLLRSLEEYPCLWYDLQFYIRDSGHILQFDVDRCFDDNQKLKKNSPHFLEAFHNYVTQALQNKRVPPLLPPSPMANFHQRPETTIIDGPTDQLLELWKFSKNVVHEEFSLQHLYLDPPTPLSDDPAKSSMVMAQPSFPTVPFRCMGNRTQFAIANVVEFLSEHYKEAEVEGDMRRLHTFELSLGRLQALMHKHHCLFNEFQIQIQSNGEVVPTNIDTCFIEKVVASEPQGNPLKKSKCLSILAKHVESLLLRNVAGKSSSSEV